MSANNVKMAIKRYRNSVSQLSHVWKIRGFMELTEIPLVYIYKTVVFIRPL